MPDLMQSLAQFWSNVAEEADKVKKQLGDNLTEAMEDFSDETGKVGKHIGDQLGDLFWGDVARYQRAALELLSRKAIGRLRNQELGRAMATWLELWNERVHVQQRLRSCGWRFQAAVLVQALEFWFCETAILKRLAELDDHLDASPAEYRALAWSPFVPTRVRHALPGTRSRRLANAFGRLWKASLAARAARASRLLLIRLDVNTAMMGVAHGYATWQRFAAYARAARLHLQAAASLRSLREAELLPCAWRRWAWWAATWEVREGLLPEALMHAIYQRLLRGWVAWAAVANESKHQDLHSIRRKLRYPYGQTLKTSTLASRHKRSPPGSQAGWRRVPEQDHQRLARGWGAWHADWLHHIEETTPPRELLNRSGSRPRAKRDPAFAPSDASIAPCGGSGSVPLRDLQLAYLQLNWLKSEVMRLRDRDDDASDDEQDGKRLAQAARGAERGRSPHQVWAEREKRSYGTPETDGQSRMRNGHRGPGGSTTPPKLSLDFPIDDQLLPDDYVLPDGYLKISVPSSREGSPPPMPPSPPVLAVTPSTMPLTMTTRRPPTPVSPSAPPENPLPSNPPPHRLGQIRRQLSFERVRAKSQKVIERTEQARAYVSTKVTTNVSVVATTLCKNPFSKPIRGNAAALERAASLRV